MLLVQVVRKKKEDWGRAFVGSSSLGRGGGKSFFDATNKKLSFFRGKQKNESPQTARISLSHILFREHSV